MLIKLSSGSCHKLRLLPIFDEADRVQSSVPFSGYPIHFQPVPKCVGWREQPRQAPSQLTNSDPCHNREPATERALGAKMLVEIAIAVAIFLQREMYWEMATRA